MNEHLIYYGFITLVYVLLSWGMPRALKSLTASQAKPTLFLAGLLSHTVIFLVTYAAVKYILSLSPTYRMGTVLVFLTLFAIPVIWRKKGGLMMWLGYLVAVVGLTYLLGAYPSFFGFFP